MAYALLLAQANTGLREAGAKKNLPRRAGFKLLARRCTALCYDSYRPSADD